jgi:hypothetical protein
MAAPFRPQAQEGAGAAQAQIVKVKDNVALKVPPLNQNKAALFQPLLEGARVFDFQLDLNFVGGLMPH